ncbi:ATP-dependent DNA helicase [Trichonephila clavipes]|nr:ATP-dependent DNA helicase [Trichonephila clavipes]
MFKIPLESERMENPVCNVKKNSDKAKVLQECVFVVWDECTMANKINFNRSREQNNARPKRRAHSADSEFSKILLDVGKGKCPEMNSTHDIELPTGICQVVSGTETLIPCIYNDVHDLDMKEDSWL